jgi:uroporphyrinogen-III synthase
LCRIKTKLLESHGFTLMFIWITSELAEIIILQQRKLYFWAEICVKKRLSKNAGITFNEIEVYQTKLAPFKISDQVWWHIVLVLLRSKLFNKQ